MSFINDLDLENKLIHYTCEWIETANEKLGMSLTEPEVLCDLKGVTAGMAYTHLWKIRYNLGLAKENYKDFIEETVPHEVAHLVADTLYKKQCNHRKEWKYVMSVFGKEPTIYHDYEVKRRVLKRYIYQCHCEDQQCRVGPKHHNTISKNSCRKIYCGNCSVVLTPHDYRGFIQYTWNNQTKRYEGNQP